MRRQGAGCAAAGRWRQGAGGRALAPQAAIAPIIAAPQNERQQSGNAHGEVQPAYQEMSLVMRRRRVRHHACFARCAWYDFSPPMAGR